MKNLDKKIDKLTEIIAKSIVEAKSKEESAALTLWPIPTPLGLLFWGNEWSKKLFQVLSLLDEKKISNHRIEESLKFPSKIVHFLFRCGDAVKDSDLEKEEKIFIIEKLFGILKIFRRKDLFCESGENIIWSREELTTVTQNLPLFSTKDKKLRRVIPDLEAALYLYTELLYWAQHPMGHCFHGPYQIKDKLLLAKEYFDLKPEVWPFTKNLRFSEVEVLEVYSKDVQSEIKLGFFERGLRNPKSLEDALEKYALRIDGEEIKEPEEISESLKNLTEVINQGTKFVSSLDQQQMIKKHADYWFYSLKPLCKLVDEDWHPPKQVKDNIYKRYEEINDIWEKVSKKNLEKTANLSYQEQTKILKKDFDPRK